jgi:hypothetical protein
LEVVGDVVLVEGAEVDIHDVSGLEWQDIELSHSHEEVVEEGCIRREVYIEERHIDDQLDDVQHAP